MIGSIAQLQAELSALGKRRAPAVPRPDDEHLAWARRVLGAGYRGSTVEDRCAARRVMEAAGLDPAQCDASRDPDSAPPGARQVAAAMLERERADAEGDRQARKAFADRGAHPGPGHGIEPGKPEPADFDRGYIEPGHASPSPQMHGPRLAPLPTGPHGITPVALAADAVASRIPDHIAAAYTMGSPSDR